VRPTLSWLGLCLAAACQPNTTRPPITPLPEAAGTEIRLSTREATRRLAEALRADSLPVRRVALRDGYIETPWFNAATRRPLRGGRRPLGPNAVRIRAWADPARPGSSQLTVETLYRPVADPSLPERELEREVARNHPVAVKVEAILRKLVEQYGGPPPPQAQSPAQPSEGAGTP
jgi:hypothetical protein